MSTLSLEPTTKTKHIPNVEVCTTAFQVFVGVYASKYPGEAPALMKHAQVVRELLQGVAIGAIMTPNFGFCVQPRPVRCHGERHTGNYGFGHRILVILLNHGTKLLVNPVYLFQKVFAEGFNRAKFVWDAPLSMLVLSVG